MYYYYAIYLLSPPLSTYITVDINVFLISPDFDLLHILFHVLGLGVFHIKLTLSGVCRATPALKRRTQAEKITS